jgi:putative membrane protein
MKVLYAAKLVIVCLPLMCIGLLASAQSQSSTEALGPVDTYFVTQTSLGTPFQVDSGNLAVTKATTQAIRDYAQLMVSSHVAVNNALDAILKKKPAVPPPTLLKAAYSTMISTLEHQGGKAFDTDYVIGQVKYQNANASLYKYEIASGADPDLKDFAKQTLPKIEDHLQRALNLQGEAQ